MSTTVPLSKQLENVTAEQEAGREKIDWAYEHMPILQALEDQFRTEQPLNGQTIGMAMHVEAKTAALVELLVVLK